MYIFPPQQARTFSSLLSSILRLLSVAQDDPERSRTGQLVTLLYAARIAAIFPSSACVLSFAPKSSLNASTNDSSFITPDALTSAPIIGVFGILRPNLSIDILVASTVNTFISSRPSLFLSSAGDNDVFIIIEPPG